ncbi:DUF5789 family protein [Halobacterium rubrum]|uniref:DUF5789 family protein n=1 Tax=Halobacterium TaxID=2239 RepID=UPI001F437EEB|nr:MULTISPECIES: hypothetical protein [Halobacterium]MDH5021555.1 hypothetical protein [Halobacterium rubrum]
MGDTRKGREDQAQEELERQQQRAVQEELDRWHETEPPRELEDALESLSYPVTADEVAETVGDYEVAVSDDEAIPVAEIVERSTVEAFDSPDEARERIQKPSVAASLRRLRAASDDGGLGSEYRAKAETFEKTLRALENIDADDDDEGVAAVTAWVVEHLEETGSLPKSRRVRNFAAEFCREHGYEVRDDDWLGA